MRYSFGSDSAGGSGEFDEAGERNRVIGGDQLGIGRDALDQAGQDPARPDLEAIATDAPNAPDGLVVPGLAIPA